MKLSNKTFRDHLELLSPLLVLITGVWLLRLVLEVLSAPAWLVRLCTVSGTVSVCVLLAVLLIHVRRFGGYANVVLSALILVVWAQLLIVLAVLFTVLTGIDTIYSLPRYSIPGPDPHHLRHIVGHLTFVVGGATLLGAAMGCFLLFLLRRYDDSSQNRP